jgi:hypothetical protein
MIELTPTSFEFNMAIQDSKKISGRFNEKNHEEWTVKPADGKNFV